jgi:hypothetical protein
MTFCVKYQAATYSGIKKVNATDGDEAINKVKSWVRKEMTLPMYSDSYKIVETIEESLEDIE